MNMYFLSTKDKAFNSYQTYEAWLSTQHTVAQKIAPMFACYGKTHALLNDYIR